MPDFGERLGGKAVDSRSTGRRKTGKTSDPDWGKHETAGSKTGKLWVKSWFGFGLHVDTRSRSRSTSASPGRRGPKPKRR